ncbi:MAG: hypothetical protein Q8L14_12240 [Myxococcales bacterium]|nr:hypothetical protein [Myxococcales bacterium]
MRRPSGERRIPLRDIRSHPLLKPVHVAVSTIAKPGVGLAGSPAAPLPPERVLSTGLSAVDELLGIGGLPRGHLIDVVAPEAHLEVARWVLYRTVATAQDDGRIACWVDAAQQLQLPAAAAAGIRPAELLVSQPDTLQHATELTLSVLRAGVVDLVVLDGLHEFDDEDAGSRFTAFVRKLQEVARRGGACVVFLHRAREARQPPMPGSNSLKWLSSIRCEVRSDILFEDERRVGRNVMVKVLKNKFAPPFGEVEVPLLDDVADGQLAEVLERSCRQGLVDGPLYSFNDTVIGVGRTAAIAWLRSHPDVAALLSEALETSGDGT